MALVPTEELTSAVIGKLYCELTQSDGIIAPPADTVFSWSTPGLPLQPEAFAAFTGSVGVSPEFSATRSQLLNFIPDPTAMNDDQFGRLAASHQRSVSDVYRQVLTMSQVVESDQSPETRREIERLRALLHETVKDRNPITEREVDRIAPTALMVAYEEKQRGYLAAALERGNRQIEALAGVDPAASQYWAMNGKLLQQREQIALDDWVTNGYKNDVEQIQAFVRQNQDRDTSLRKADLLEQLDSSRRTPQASSNDEYPTTLGESSEPWKRFAFRGDEVARYRDAHTNAPWPVRPGSGFLGLLGGGPERSSFGHPLDAADFALECEYTEAPIVREWFDASFLTSNSWRFDNTNPAVRAQVLSDGAQPPRGLLPAYPVAAVLVRNLSVSFGGSAGIKSLLADHKQARQGQPRYISMGPLFLGGSSSSRLSVNAAASDWGFDDSSDGLSFKAVQLIGYRCRVLPKSPQYDPSIPEDHWV